MGDWQSYLMRKAACSTPIAVQNNLCACQFILRAFIIAIFLQRFFRNRTTRPKIRCSFVTGRSRRSHGYQGVVPISLDELIRFARAPGIELVLVQRHRGVENRLHDAPSGFHPIPASKEGGITLHGVSK